MAAVSHFKTFSTHPACRIILDSTSAVTDELAERMGVSQKRVSSLESGDVDKTEIRTLRRYLDAIGGRLQVNAIMPDGRTLQLV